MEAECSLRVDGVWEAAESLRVVHNPAANGHIPRIFRRLLEPAVTASDKIIQSKMKEN